MKNTVGHTGIYAWGDCVRHRFFQKLRSNRRTKNPLPLGMGSVKLWWAYPFWICGMKFINMKKS